MVSSAIAGFGDKTVARVYATPVLVFGCGNTLFGNDGFGPAVIEALERDHLLPETVLALDAGTGIRDLLFDLLLMERKPELVIVVDAVTVQGRSPGEVFELDLSEVPREKMSDFSVHQSPSTNLLKELQACGGVEVRVLGVHTDFIPNRIAPGLDPDVEKAIPVACRRILEAIGSRTA
jgi:coenzyme F420 hydrogenase subunit delta